MGQTDARLKIVVEQGGASGTELPLSGGAVVIGRDPRADMVVSGDETVSKRHVEVTVRGDEVLLRNLSPNGTLVNGRPVMEAPLTAGDSIAIGLHTLLRVRPYVAAPPAPAVPAPRAGGIDTDKTVAWAPPRVAPSVPPAGTEPAAEPAAAGRLKLPVWLVAYLALMVVAFIGLLVMRMLDPGPPGLTEIQAREQAFATANRLADVETARVLRLLETAVVHERRGDERSAYEIYREMLGARWPVQPESPAYRYATSRIATLGPK